MNDNDILALYKPRVVSEGNTHRITGDWEAEFTINEPDPDQTLFNAALLKIIHARLDKGLMV